MMTAKATFAGGAAPGSLTLRGWKRDRALSGQGHQVEPSQEGVPFDHSDYGAIGTWACVQVSFPARSHADLPGSNCLDPAGWSYRNGYGGCWLKIFCFLLHWVGGRGVHAGGQKEPEIGVAHPPITVRRNSSKKISTCIATYHGTLPSHYSCQFHGRQAVIPSAGHVRSVTVLSSIRC